MRPFLFTTARHLAVDWLRREKRGRAALVRRREDSFFAPRAEESVASRSADPEETSRLLHGLPPAQREVVVLRALVGLRFGEIASLLRVPENTVVSRFRYGIEKLRARWLQGGRCGRND